MIFPADVGGCRTAGLHLLCTLRGDLAQAMASNRELEEDNRTLQHEVDDLRARWSQQQVTEQ